MVCSDEMQNLNAVKRFQWNYEWNLQTSFRSLVQGHTTSYIGTLESGHMVAIQWRAFWCASKFWTDINETEFFTLLEYRYIRFYHHHHRHPSAAEKLITRFLHAHRSPANVAISSADISTSWYSNTCWIYVMNEVRRGRGFLLPWGGISSCRFFLWKMKDVRW